MRENFAGDMFLRGDELRRFLRGSDTIRAEAAVRGETEDQTIERLVEIAERAVLHQQIKESAK